MKRFNDKFLNDEYYQNFAVKTGKLQKQKQFLQCGCGRRFSYKGGLRFHMKWECEQNHLTFRDIKILRGLQMVNRKRTMKSKKSDNKKFDQKIICICGRRFSYVGGLTYHKKGNIVTKKKIIPVNVTLINFNCFSVGDDCISKKFCSHSVSSNVLFFDVKADSCLDGYYSSLKATMNIRLIQNIQNENFSVAKNLRIANYRYFKELYYPDIDEKNPFDIQNLYQKRLLKNRHRENGSANKKLAVKLNCACGRSFSYVAGYRYHMRHECGKILKCLNCGKVYTDKSNLVKHSNLCALKYLTFKTETFKTE
ncbi:hypothetical protein Bhyg_07151 [Pseudolycoriella hygida]|uniref:C2H2-type domain-containing protein n=1 Tax=Pseudolycoriella hygida TaxID=35572 RepID=A0A9Q0N416_9DIPT|nr:hypothetical protein Bhyg_07151 [Pseudolycoriella hygida]